MVIMGFVNAWLIWLAGEGKKERAHMEDRLNEMREAISEFEIRVSRDYVRTEAVREIKETISLGIELLTERIDRLVDLRTAPPSS